MTLNRNGDYTSCGCGSAHSAVMTQETEESIRHTLSLYGVKEAMEVLRALEDGRIDGTAFLRDNGCGCLIGTLQKAEDPSAPCSHGVSQDGDYWAWALEEYDSEEARTFAAQRWFAHIAQFDTPENNAWSHHAHRVIRKWVEENILPIVDVATTARCIPKGTADAVEHAAAMVKA